MPWYKNRLKQALRNSTADGTASSVMSAITGTYTTPFALALGASDMHIGLLNSLPKLAGTLSQSFAGQWIRATASRKSACNIAALFSRLIWLPIALIPFIFTDNPIFWLIGLLSISQMASSLATTAWASWMGDLVPVRIMGRYFGMRNAVGGMAAFLTTIIAGTILTTLDGMFGFTTIFILAVAAGLISNFYLRRIPDVSSVDGRYARSTMKEFVKELKFNIDFRKFTFYITAFYLATYIAAPFFIVSMLKDFNIGYEAFTLIIALNVLTTIVSQPYWGRLADRFGDKAVLTVCSFFTTMVPGLWLFVHEPIGMAAVYILSGFGWAGFDLATFNYLLGVTHHRPSYIANYSMLTGFAIVAGPLIGGFLAQSDISFATLRGLSMLFLVSFIFRAVFSILLLPGLVETRPAKTPPSTLVLLWKSMTIYPIRFFSHELAVAQHYIYHHRRR
ncbi:MAG: MFS transporter [Candidatus Aenigmatarchaeota archaeon]|nr:MFS transporter [Candidatus Aenigmarchaeota archaeon]